MIKTFGPVRSGLFTFQEEDVWFELNPYTPGSLDQPWVTTRVDLWGGDGPYATLSINPEKPIPLPFTSFFVSPTPYLRPLITILEEDGWLQPAVTEQGAEMYPPQRIGLYPELSRVYRLTRRALELFKALPETWPSPQEAYPWIN